MFIDAYMYKGFYLGFLFKCGGIANTVFELTTH